MAAHQAAGSCHKGPSGASTRAGRNGLKIVKKAGLVVDGLLQRGQTAGKLPKISQRQRGSRPSVADIRSARIISSRGFAASWVIAAGGGETHYARVMGAAGGAVPGSIKTCSTE